jgi:7-cyano-7-deazaguanine synthase
VLLSGGIDSAASLRLTQRTHVARALTFVYHGIAASELKSASEIGAWAKVKEHRFIRVPDLREVGDIRGTRLKRLPPTYIPMRNAIFYSFASSYAEEVGASLIVGGHNLDDLAIFKDVSESFFSALEAALIAGSSRPGWNGLRISRPLKGMTKPEVIVLASRIGVPLELTWSCHRGGPRHCWKCAGCLSRREAFKKANVEDPLSGTSPAKIT